jgi:hypothetical protein
MLVDNDVTEMTSCMKTTFPYLNNALLDTALQLNDSVTTLGESFQKSLNTKFNYFRYIYQFLCE